MFGETPAPQCLSAATGLQAPLNPYAPLGSSSLESMSALGITTNGAHCTTGPVHSLAASSGALALASAGAGALPLPSTALAGSTNGLWAKEPTAVAFEKVVPSYASLIRSPSATGGRSAPSSALAGLAAPAELHSPSQRDHVSRELSRDVGPRRRLSADHSEAHAPSVRESLFEASRDLSRDVGPRRRLSTDLSEVRPLSTVTHAETSPVAPISGPSISERALDRVVGIVGGGLGPEAAQQLSPSNHLAKPAVQGGVGGSPESALTLQRRLNAETSDREACQFALVKIRRVVGFFRQQVHAATDNRAPFDPTAQHLRELSDALEVEVRNATSLAGATGVDMKPVGGLLDGFPLASAGGCSSPKSPSRGSYEVLRQSLQDAQRRCENLHMELMKQTQANEDLIGSLTRSEAANKRLTDQVRQHSEEISTLARQRITDEERIEEFRRQHRHEDEGREKEIQRRVSEATSAANAKCLEVQQAAAAKSRKLRMGIEQLRRQLDRLRMDKVEQGHAVHSMRETMRQLLHQMERSILQRADMLAKRQVEMQVSTSDVARDLEMRVAAEHEMRVSEVTSWSHRHALLTAERDELQARLTRDVAQLSAQLQASERTREEDQRAWTDERGQLIRRADQIAQLQTSLEAQCDQLRQSLCQSEADKRSLEQEHRGAQSAMAELQRKVHESSVSLASAELMKDRLQEKLNEQQKQFADMSDAAVVACKEAYEKRIVRMSADSKAELSAVTERLRQLEDISRTTEKELEQSSQRAQGAVEDAYSLRRDLERQRAESEDIDAARRALDSELVASRRELSDERARLHAAVDRLEVRRTALEAEVQGLQEKLTEKERQATEREARDAQRCSVLEASIRDRDFRIEDREKQLQEAKHTSSEIAIELTSQQKLAAQLQSTLDKVTNEAAEERKRLEEERRRLEDTITSQAQSAKESNDQHTKFRDSQMSSLKQLQDESSTRFATLERERDAVKTELVESKMKLSETEKRFEAAEQDLTRVRYLLNESQASIALIRQDKDREEQEASAAKQQLHQELKQVSAALETALKNEAMLNQKIDEETSRHRQGEQKLESEIVDARKAGEVQVSEREQRLERVRHEYESRIKSLESRHTSELERERVRVDAVLRENEQLRNFLADHRKSSTVGMSALQSQLETHIQRLQQHTNELRGDLNRSELLTSSPSIGVATATPGRNGDVTGSSSSSFGPSGGGSTPAPASPPSLGGAAVAGPSHTGPAATASEEPCTADVTAAANAAALRLLTLTGNSGVGTGMSALSRGAAYQRNGHQQR